MNPIKPGDSAQGAHPKDEASTVKEPRLLPTESKFLGITEKSNTAIFELTSLSQEKSKVRISKEQILGEIQAVMSGERKVEEIPHLLTSSNLNRVINSYYKQSLLPSATIQLIKDVQSRSKGESLAQKPIATAEAASIDTISASKDDTDSKVGKTLAVENFSMKDDKESFLKELFANQRSKTKILTEDLAPHFRHILGKPRLTDKEIRQARLASTSSSQITTNLKRLRDDFLKAIVKNETVSLPVWLKTDLGKNVSANLEAVLYDTASHVHRQVQHQLEKGKQADSKVINNQIQAYIKTTNIMASIVKRQRVAE